MTDQRRVDNAPAYLLHAFPFSETSLIVDVLTRDFGRVSLLARGARRPRSAIRGMLMAFQPLEVGWFGGGEVKTLAKLEWVGGLPLLKGRCLLLGYYLNELLVSLLPKEDPHPGLFSSYGLALTSLAQGFDDAPELRRFELAVLRELGYGVSLGVDADTGQPVEPELIYAFVCDRGAVRESASQSVVRLAGKTLLDMAHDDYSDPRTRFESKLLMRYLISHRLGGRLLHSRRIFMELNEL